MYYALTRASMTSFFIWICLGQKTSGQVNQLNPAFELQPHYHNDPPGFIILGLYTRTCVLVNQIPTITTSVILCQYVWLKSFEYQSFFRIIYILLLRGRPKMSTFSQVYKPYVGGEGVTPDVHF